MQVTLIYLYASVLAFPFQLLKCVAFLRLICSVVYKTKKNVLLFFTRNHQEAEGKYYTFFFRQGVNETKKLTNLCSFSFKPKNNNSVFGKNDSKQKITVFVWQRTITWVNDD